MVMIVSTIPLNEIKSKEQIVESKEIFLFQDDLRNKKIGDNGDLNRFYDVLCWASRFYDKLPTVYFMTNRYYNRSEICKVMGNSYLFMSHEKSPQFIDDAFNYPEKYPRVEKRVFTDEMIFATFSSLQYANFKVNEVVVLNIGEVFCK